MPNALGAVTPPPRPHFRERLAIVGPGALGCLLAGTLSRAGRAITLVDYRPDRAERLRATGITIEAEGRHVTTHPAVTAEPGTLGVHDWVIILVKAQDTAGAAASLPPLIGRETLVLSLQNGLGHEEMLYRVVRSEQVALGVTSQGATLLSDGRVRHAGQGPTRLGLGRPNHPLASSLASLAQYLQGAGWPTEVVTDIRPHLWRKLLVNVGINALTALTGLVNGALLDYQETSELQELAVQEAWAVAVACGVSIDLTFQEALGLVRSVSRATAANRSSMLQDRLRGRPTEVAFINGAVARLGRRQAVPTPVNQTLTLLVEIQGRLGWTPPCVSGNGALAHS